MVRNIRGQPGVWSWVALTLGLLALSGCRQWKFSWGEAPVSPEIIDLAKKSASPACASPLLIFDSEDEKHSNSVLSCWEQTAQEVFAKVKGARNEELSRSEIHYLIRQGVISWGSDREENVRQVDGLLALGGFDRSGTDERAGISKARVQSWIDWVRVNRASLRKVRALWLPPPEVTARLRSEPRKRASDLSLLVQVAVSALRLAEFDLSPERMASVLGGTLVLQDPQWKKALAPVSRSLLELAGAFCPGLSQWRSLALADCFERGMRGLSRAPHYLEWVMNPVERFTRQDAETLEQEIRVLSQGFQEWFQQPGLQGIGTRHWIEMMNALGAKLPPDFESQLGWIEKLGGKSTRERVDPSAISRFFAVSARAQIKVWRGMPEFFEFMNQGRCPLGSRWTNCVAPRWEYPAQDPESLRWALRLKSLRWGGEAVPFSGRRFTELAYFSELASEVFRAFDEDQDGWIAASLSEESNEVLSLLASALQAIEVWDRLVTNFQRKIRGEALSLEGESRFAISGLGLKGLSRLLAMGGELWVLRDTPEERNAIEEVLGSLWNFFPRSSVLLDQKALSAVFYMAFTLSDHTEAYLADLSSAGLAELAIDAPRPGVISRSLLQKRLPELLKTHFPRTFESCQSWGWAKSCEPALMKVLPELAEAPGWMNSGDLDLLTLIAASMEGLLDYCDRDADGKLEGIFLGGADELDCAVTHAKDAVVRLMESRIIGGESFWSRAGLELGLTTMNSIFLTRHFGKVSLIRGTPTLVPVWGIWRSANLGSMYSLLSNL
jgi:hypothetical protein